MIRKQSSIDKIIYEANGQKSFFGRDNLSFKTVNMSKKHQKQDQKNEGGIINKEMPITLSNLMLLYH